MSAQWLFVAGLLLMPARPSLGSARLSSGSPSGVRADAAAAATVGTQRAAVARSRRHWTHGIRLARRPLVAAVGFTAAGAAVLVGAQLAVAASTALIAVVVVDELGSVAARRRDNAAERGVATAVEVLAAELAAGARESAALRAAADAGGPAARCLCAAAGLGEIGADPATAFDGAFSGLAGAWQIRATCGTALGPSVASVGEDLSARIARRRALEVALAGARASGAMLALLPVLGVVLGAAMGASPLSFLFGGGRGSLALLTGVGLEVSGWFWIRLLIRRASL